MYHEKLSETFDLIINKRTENESASAETAPPLIIVTSVIPEKAGNLRIIIEQHKSAGTRQDKNKETDVSRPLHLKPTGENNLAVSVDKNLVTNKTKISQPASQHHTDSILNFIQQDSLSKAEDSKVMIPPAQPYPSPSNQQLFDVEERTKNNKNDTIPTSTSVVTRFSKIDTSSFIRNTMFVFYHLTNHSKNSKSKLLICTCIINFIQLKSSYA
jgi:hypothetical protein